MGAVGVIGASHSLFPSWMPKLAFRPPNQQAPGDILVHIFLRGGIDGLSVVPPYSEGSLYYDARPTQAVPEPGSGTDSALDLDGRFGLHPTLAPLKDIYDEGDLAFVQATGLTDPTRSHFDAMLFMEHGAPGDKGIGTGWIGRHLQSAAWQNDSPFRAVGMGAIVPDVLRGPVNPLALKSIADFHFRGREDEMANLRRSLTSLYAMNGPTDPLNRQAQMVFETIDLLSSLDVENYTPAGGATYPEDEEGFGLALQQIAQLIKADVGLEVASVDLGGWDTHTAQGTLDGEFNTLLGSLGQGLHALYTDLGDHMRKVTVVVLSEFGRTIEENASQGTDHGHGNMMMLMSGGVHGGQVFANWLGLGPEGRDDADDLAITTDYRAVMAEMVQRRLLNSDLNAIFPKFTPKTLNLFENVND
jgi:uncharacterized protein (DUF1501 family)